MRAEIDFYVPASKRYKDISSLVNKLVVNKGSAETSTFLDPTGIVVACDITQTKATVYITDPKEVSVRLYKDSNAKLSHKKNTKKPIEISGEESLLISSRKTGKWINVYLSDKDLGDDDKSTIPVDKDRSRI